MINLADIKTDNYIGYTFAVKGNDGKDYDDINIIFMYNKHGAGAFGSKKDEEFLSYFDVPFSTFNMIGLEGSEPIKGKYEITRTFPAEAFPLLLTHKINGEAVGSQISIGPEGCPQTSFRGYYDMGETAAFNSYFPAVNTSWVYMVADGFDPSTTKYAQNTIQEVNLKYGSTSIYISGVNYNDFYNFFNCLEEEITSTKSTIISDEEFSFEEPKYQIYKASLYEGKTKLSDHKMSRPIIPSKKIRFFAGRYQHHNKFSRMKQFADNMYILRFYTEGVNYYEEYFGNFINDEKVIVEKGKTYELYVNGGSRIIWTTKADTGDVSGVITYKYAGNTGSNTASPSFIEIWQGLSYQGRAYFPYKYVFKNEKDDLEYLNLSANIYAYNGNFETNGDVGQWTNQFYDGAEPEPEPGPKPGGSDPYPGSDPNKPDGGDGPYDNNSDIIDQPSLPGVSSIGTGFITLYNPEWSEIQRLASFMWSADFIDNVKKMFGDPADVILSLHYMPASPNVGSAKESITAGFIDTGIQSYRLSSQFRTVDLGTVELKKYYNNFLDFAPYTNISVFLPFIGRRSIETDKYIGKSINIKYNIDFMTGSCVAILSDASNGMILDSFTGFCAMEIPVSSSNYSDIYRSAIGAISGAVAGIASGGITSAAGSLVSSALSVSSTKPSYAISGRSAGNSAYLDVLYPYFEIERQIISKPDQMAKFSGYPSNITYKIGDLSGFTIIDAVHLENMGRATDEEINMIEEMLKEGVIL